MIRVVWNVSVLIHGLLQFAPTNLLAAAIRTPRGLKWGCAAMLLGPVYFYGAGICVSLIDHGAPQWLAFVSALMLWNGFKMLWLGPISLVLLARNAIRAGIRRTRERKAQKQQALAERNLPATTVA